MVKLDCLGMVTCGIKLRGKREHHGRLAMMPSVVILHPLQLPAGRDLSRPHITKDIT
jgi:hypothetical protein